MPVNNNTSTRSAIAKDKFFDADFNLFDRRINNALRDPLSNEGVDDNDYYLEEALTAFTLSRQGAFDVSGSANQILLTSISNYVSTNEVVNYLKITRYIHKSIFFFEPAQQNTGSVQINIDSYGLRSLKYDASTELPVGSFNKVAIIQFIKTGAVGVGYFKLLNPKDQSQVSQKITPSNDSISPNTVMNFSAGTFVYSDYSGSAYLNAIKKSISSTWVVGTGNGGLDTGTVANSTWYYCYAIYNPTTFISDVIISANNTTPALPSGYTKYKYIGAFKTNFSGNILTGTWLKNGYFSFTNAITEENTNDITAAGNFTLTSVPSVSVMAHLSVHVHNTSQNAYPHYYAGTSVDNKRMVAIYSGNVGGSAGSGFVPTSNAIIYRESGGESATWLITVYANGYFDLNL